MMKLFMVFRALSASLKNGDVLSIDLVSAIDGYHGDSAVTIPIGHVKPDVDEIVKSYRRKSVQGN